MSVTKHTDVYRTEPLVDSVCARRVGQLTFLFSSLPSLRCRSGLVSVAKVTFTADI